MQEVPRDFQQQLLTNLQKKMGEISKQNSIKEMKGLLKEMRVLVKTFPLDEDIIVSLSHMVDRIVSVLNLQYVNKETLFIN